MTPREITFLKLLRRTKVLDRKTVQRELFSSDDDGSVTRDFLRSQVVKRHARRFGPTNEFAVQVAPVYYPHEQGCALLATELDDMRWQLDASPHIHPQDIPHALARSRLIIDLDKAVAAQSYVAMPGLFTEMDVVNSDESDPSKRFKLYTVVSETAEKKVVCVPDMVTLVRVGKFQRVYSWEIEMGSDSPGRISGKKNQGVFGVSKHLLFRRWFPEASDMRVVAVCPGRSFRDSLRKAMQDKPGGKELWLFVDRADLTIDKLLHAPIFYRCGDDSPIPLVKAPLVAPAEDTGGQVPGEPRGEPQQMAEPVTESRGAKSGLPAAHPLG